MMKLNFLFFIGILSNFPESSFSELTACQSCPDLPETDFGNGAFLRINNTFENNCKIAYPACHLKVDNCAVGLEIVYADKEIDKIGVISRDISSGGKLSCELESDNSIGWFYNGRFVSTIHCEIHCEGTAPPTSSTQKISVQSTEKSIIKPQNSARFGRRGCRIS